MKEIIGVIIDHSWNIPSCLVSRQVMDPQQQHSLLGCWSIFKAALTTQGLCNSTKDIPHDMSCILHGLKSSSPSDCTQSLLDFSSPIKRELKYCITGLGRREIIDMLTPETVELLSLFSIRWREKKKAVGLCRESFRWSCRLLLDVILKFPIGDKLIAEKIKSSVYFSPILSVTNIKKIKHNENSQDAIYYFDFIGAGCHFKAFKWTLKAFSHMMPEVTAPNEYQWPLFDKKCVSFML